MAAQDKPPLVPERSTTFIQASFRLHPETLEAIRSISASSGISQSEVMRQATQLLKNSKSVASNIKLANVDIDDHKGPEYYRVVSWIVE